jgi:lipid-A-disaccharide synthase
LARLLKTCRYITLVNLLAEKELFPEFPSERCESEAVARQVLRWLTEPEVYGKVCDELAELKSRVAEPGACERAAKLILNTLAPPLAA